MTTGTTVAWRHPLRHLVDALGYELAKPTGPAFARARLPNGAFVVLQRDADGRRVVTVGRAERPTTPEGLKRWAKEVETFRTHLGLTGWTSVNRAARIGIVAAFAEPVDAPQTQLAGL